MALFDQMTVNGDKKGILAVLEFQTKGQIIHSSISGVDHGKNQNFGVFFSYTNCSKAD